MLLSHKTLIAYMTRKQCVGRFCLSIENLMCRHYLRKRVDYAITIIEKQIFKEMHSHLDRLFPLTAHDRTEQVKN